MKAFTIPPYNYRLHVSIGDSPDKMIRSIHQSVKKSGCKLSSPYQDEIKKEHKNIVGYFLDLNEELPGHGMIWLSTDFKPERREQFVTLSHEVNHASIAIFEFIGSNVNKETEEPFCYLHDYILELCLREVDKARDGDNTKAQHRAGEIQKLGKDI